jgi:ribosomal protein L35AE/L33A
MKNNDVLNSLLENLDFQNESTLQMLSKAREVIFNKIYPSINNLGIPIINDCKNVNPQGFMIEIENVEKIEELKPLISEGSLCVCYVQKVKENDYIGDISQFVGQEKIIDIYIRLGLTNTWIHLNFQTLIYLILEAKFEKNYMDDEDLDSYDEDYDYETENNIDYERLNRLATIVAKSKGFNLLKNRDQRKIFAKEVLTRCEEEFENFELHGISTTAESIYDFGVLPLEARKLQLDGKSEQEIAKTLGHTKAKIEKALLCEVSDIIRKNIEQYEENHPYKKLE